MLDGDVLVGGPSGCGGTTSLRMVNRLIEPPNGGESSIWPFYYSAPVVRGDVIEENLGMEGILSSVTETLSADNIRGLNGQMDAGDEDPEEVARDFLERQGLI